MNVDLYRTMLLVRVKRLGGPRATIPASMLLHSTMLPNEEQIRDAIEAMYQT